MDSKNLSGIASNLGEKVSGLGGQNPEKMLDNLFPKTGYKISKEEFVKMQECANMLEKYVDRFPKAKGCVKLEGKDAYEWKEHFFPELVEGGPKLPDYAFFSSSNKNCGIGIDAEFSAVELFQFLYRLYKEIVNKLE